MKSIILSVLILGSFANANHNPVICKNENTQMNQQTIVVLSENNLAAICQRSLDANSPKKSNEEICADDMYPLSSSSSGMGKLTNVYESLTKGTVITLKLNGKKGTAEFNSEYRATTFKGGNEVLIPKGNLEINCN